MLLMLGLVASRAFVWCTRWLRDIPIYQESQFHVEATSVVSSHAIRSAGFHPIKTNAPRSVDAIASNVLIWEQVDIDSKHCKW